MQEDQVSGQGQSLVVFKLAKFKMSLKHPSEGSQEIIGCILLYFRRDTGAGKRNLVIEIGEIS